MNIKGVLSYRHSLRNTRHIILVLLFSGINTQKLSTFAVRARTHSVTLFAINSVLPPKMQSSVAEVAFGYPVMTHRNNAIKILARLYP